MSDPVTANRALTVPTTGADPEKWGPIVNGNFTIIDNLLGKSVSIALTSGPVVLTSAQAQSMRIELTGTLTGACTIQVPQAPGLFAFHDNTDRTTSVYPITVTTGSTSGRTQNLPAGTSDVFTDGTNCYLEFEPRPGQVDDFAGANAPPLWGLCYGQAVSRTTYADLFAAIGTTWGAGDGSTTFNLPDFRGRTTAGADAMGGTAAARLTSASIGVAAVLGAVGGSELMQSHNHALSETGHTHIQDAHNHSLGDTGHTHIQDAHNHTALGHTHSESAGGHQHFTTVNRGTSFGALSSTQYSAGGLTGSTSSAGLYTSPESLNIQAGYAAFASVAPTNAPASTGVTIENATATNQAASTGVTFASTGAGASQNLPPAAVTNKIIYMGQ